MVGTGRAGQLEILFPGEAASWHSREQPRRGHAAPSVRREVPARTHRLIRYIGMARVDPHQRAEHAVVSSIVSLMAQEHCGHARRPLPSVGAAGAGRGLCRESACPINTAVATIYRRTAGRRDVGRGRVTRGRPASRGAVAGSAGAHDRHCRRRTCVDRPRQGHR